MSNNSPGRPQAYRFIGGPELPLKASSDETYQFIQGCLSDCLQNHPLCREESQGLDDEEWPRRILAIDPLSSQVKLIEFNVAMAQQYTALSYCWGPVPPPIRASLSTLHKLKRGLSISSLPQTLEDAVLASIKLGSYLIWIDSLCIIQDDSSDWEKESCKMSTVYRHALLTIIASCSSSCNEGFLDRERDAPVLLQRLELGGQWTEVRARKVSRVGYHRPYKYDHGGEHRGVEPVDIRGWTLQEKLLSPRSVTFTSDEVQWECRAVKRCECNQPPSEGAMNHLSLSPIEEWFSTLEDYTTRRLTNKTDRLVALSGISKAMSRSLHARYAAGIWVTTESTMLMVKGLLWHKVPGITRPSFAPEEYLAPSFSWASIMGEVIHHKMRRLQSHSYLSRILEVDLILGAPDPFGSVAHGTLGLEGKLVRTKMSWRKIESKLKMPPFIELPIWGSTCYIDVPLKRVSLPEGGFTLQRRTSANLEESEHFNDTTDYPETEVIILPLIVYIEDSYIGQVIAGLILGQCPTLQGYQRLGYTSFPSKAVESLENINTEIICIY